MTADALLHIVCKTESNKNKKQHGIGCEYIQSEVNHCQLTTSYTLGMRRELRNQLVPLYNGLPPLSTKTSVRTVHEMTHHNVGHFRLNMDEYHHKHSAEITKQPFVASEEATQEYMVVVGAESHC